MEWHWPQYVYLSIYIASVISGAFKSAAQTTVEKRVGALAFNAVFTGLEVYTLHCGGFW